MSSQQPQQVRSTEKYTLAELLAFYFPLAISSMLMFTTFNIINSALARTINAEAALAAFAIGQSITNMFASPTFTGRQMLVALAHHRQNFRSGLKVMLKIMLATLFVIALLALTPVGYFVYVTLFGAPPHLFAEVRNVAKVCLTLPFIYTLRAASQGILMIRRRTHFMTISMVMRLLIMLLVAAVITRTSVVQGAVVGALVWVMGMTTEALFCFIFARRLYPDVPEESNEVAAVTQSEVFDFLWPLLITSFIWTFSRPIINAGLGRTADPEQALATYQVAWNFAWIPMAFIEVNIRQLVLIFGRGQSNLNYLKRFCLTVSILVTLAVLVLAWTPIGAHILKHIIGVSEEMIGASRGTIVTIAFVPLLLTWVEYFTGRVLQSGSTKSLSLAKSANLVMMALTVFVLAALFPHLGATAGALAVMAGIAAELIVVWLALRKAALER